MICYGLMCCRFRFIRLHLAMVNNFNFYLFIGIVKNLVFINLSKFKLTIIDEKNNDTSSQFRNEIVFDGMVSQLGVVGLVAT